MGASLATVTLQSRILSRLFVGLCGVTPPPSLENADEAK
jgi:hypothetical protein